MQTKLLIIYVNYDAIYELVIIYSAFNKYSRKNGNKNGAVHHLSTDIKKAYDLVGKDVLNNILIEFDIPMKLVGLTMRYLNEIELSWGRINFSLTHFLL
jgi:hypothetical protein